MQLDQLKLRKRFFSLDESEFPSLDVLDKEIRLSKRKDSLMKYRSGLSTICSMNSDEPIIEDIHEEEGDTEFHKYMVRKDLQVSKVRRVSFDGALIEAPQITLHWKLLAPSFFEPQTRKEASPDNSNEEDFEYLSNPGRYQLNHD